MSHYNWNWYFLSGKVRVEFKEIVHTIATVQTIDVSTESKLLTAAYLWIIMLPVNVKIDRCIYFFEQFKGELKF